MRRLLSALLLAAATLAGLAGPARADDGDAYDKIRERGVLEVAVYANYPPFSYDSDGRYTGLDVDIAEALAKSLGLQLKLRPVVDGEDMDDDLRNYVWRGTIVGNAPADLMMHIGADPEYVRRQDKVSIFGVYLHESVALGLRSQRFKNFGGLDDLKGRKTAVQLGSISDLYLSDAFGGLLRESLVRLPSTEAAVKAFISDQVDAVVAPRSELQGLLKIDNAPSIQPKPVQFSGLFRSAWDVGMAVKANAPRLKAALEDALVKLANSGELERIYAARGLDYTRPQSAASAVGTP